MQLCARHCQITTSFLLSILVCLFVLNACNSEKVHQEPPPPELGIVTVREQYVFLITELPGQRSAYLVVEMMLW